MFASFILKVWTSKPLVGKDCKNEIKKVFFKDNLFRNVLRSIDEIFFYVFFVNFGNFIW
jgi:hypothetical protein